MVIAMLNLDLTSLGYALGRLAGATRFASPEIQKVAALATVSDAWRAYRRDAGAGDVGPAHEASANSMSILLTDDPRRCRRALTRYPRCAGNNQCGHDRRSHGQSDPRIWTRRVRAA